MNSDEFSQLSDKELLEEVEKNKPSPIIDAFFIGFLVGILLFSAGTNRWGLVSLIPLFLIYLILKKPKRWSALKNELNRRNLS